MTDLDSSVPFYMQIYDFLYQQITTNQLLPDSRIPSEDELSTQFGVSRMTARKAIDKLVFEGRLYRKQGKGTFVTNSVMSYGLSTMLSFSKTLRARGYNVTTKVLLQNIVPITPEIGEKLHLRETDKLIVIRRLRYIDGRPAAIHTTYLDYKSYYPLLSTDFSKESLLEMIEKVSGNRVAYSKDQVRAVSVNPQDAKLLEVPAGSPVLLVEGVAYSDDGRPSRFARSFFRGDLFQFCIVNSGNPGMELIMANETPVGQNPDGA
jgi:GntR family transcriptional regulator